MAVGLKRVGYELSRQLQRRQAPFVCRRFLTEISSPKSAPSPASIPGRGTQRRVWRLAKPFSLAAGVGLLATILVLSDPEADKSTHSSSNGSEANSINNDDAAVPSFRLAEVREHGADSRQPWVTYEDKVYDITDWVAAHPGGDVILRAAGGAIEPYWDLFAIHKQQHVREVLDQYLIGYIDRADLVDGRPPAEQVEDPFLDDPSRDGRLMPHTLKPCNAETPRDELDGEFHTPNELFFVRNHMWVPRVAGRGDDHVLSVELPDGESRQYTLAELKARFPVHRVTAALQCSGNRRRDMTRHAGKTNGLQWEVGAIGNAEWEGVRLSDVLADAGLRVQEASSLTKTSASAGDRGVVDASTHHVQFSGLEAYGASIPLSKALDPRGDVLLAFAMNGQALPRDHGFPLRAVVPGHVAARSVKWLSKVVISDEESPSQWQRRDYKSFGPNAGANPDWDSAPAIQELPVTSAITRVWVGDGVANTKIPPADTPARGEVRNAITMQGYAYSGGGRRITRVDVSLDGGRTWDQAVLLDRGDVGTATRWWAWTRWQYRGQLHGLEDQQAGEKNCTTLVVKATDESYNSQPERHAGIYNVRGNLANAWHRIRICPKYMPNGSGLVWSTPENHGPGLMTRNNEAKAAFSAGVQS